MLVAFVAAARDGMAQATGAPTRPAARPESPAIDLRAEEQAIRALSQRWLAAERNRDVDGVMANFAGDAEAVYGGRLLTGADAIRREREQNFATLPRARPGYVPSWRTTAVRVARAGDLAYEWGTYDDSWNGGRNRERGHYLTIWRNVGGEWKVARDMATPEAKPGPASSSAP